MRCSNSRKGDEETLKRRNAEMPKPRNIETSKGNAEIKKTPKRRNRRTSYFSVSAFQRFPISAFQRFGVPARWLWLCGLSLFVYLLLSEAVAAFLRQASRLMGKF